MVNASLFYGLKETESTLLLLFFGNFDTLIVFRITVFLTSQPILKL